MKIGIITFHASFNYGSMLQAYALQSVLKNMGHNVEIINFRSKEQKRLYKHPLNLNGMPIKTKIARILLFKRTCALINRWNKFDEFLNEDLNITKEYNTIEELRTEKFDYDLVISGSDQIWNVNATDFSEAYFLTFLSDKIKRVSYAVSIGTTPFKCDIKPYEDALKKYDSISVREQKTKERIVGLGLDKDIRVDVDPTLLLEEKDYDVFKLKRLVQHDYVLYYVPFPRKKLLSVAAKIAKKQGLKLVAISSMIMSRKDVSKHDNVIEYYNCGPKDFLSLVKHAKFTIGWSFHLVVFSIIFKKDFYTFAINNDSRINNLLEKLDLTNRIINEDNTELEFAKINNFDKIQEKLSFLRKDSINYLRDIATK